MKTTDVLRVAIISTVVAALVGCGGDRLDQDEIDAQSRAIDERQAAMLEKARQAVEDRRLPEVALAMFDANGALRRNFIAGPDRGEDVVRTRKGGTRGPRLRWDLDGDGRVRSDEREITESELFDALPALLR